MRLWIGATVAFGAVVRAAARPFTGVQTDAIVALAAQHRLPAVYPFRVFTAGGGLISYGIDIDDLFRRAPAYVDRILKGAKSGDLPVQNPTKFELVYNLKTAKALGRHHFTVAPAARRRPNRIRLATSEIGTNAKRCRARFMAEHSA